jgi:hypothetical protein
VTNPIKLTDSRLDELARPGCEWCRDPRDYARQDDTLTAIRTLRDRARAVVGSSGEPFLNRIGKRIAVDAEYIEALREVLP